MKINLTHDTVTQEDKDALADWIRTADKLTKGPETLAFEKEFAEYIGTRYALFCNSGSSANLLMLSSLIPAKEKRRVIVPIISWATDVSPILQLGYEPVFIGYDENLQPSIKELELAIVDYKADTFLCVSALGIPPNMSEIKKICDFYNVLLLEDNCESLGAKHESKMLGQFGLMASYSFYYSHHISTIEGGMVVTDNKDVYRSLLSKRSHGWIRDWEEYPFYEKEMGVRAKYYFPSTGYNLRATDLQAFLGRRQLKLMPEVVRKRNENFEYWSELTANKNDCKIKKSYSDRFSSFAMPVIKINKSVKQMSKHFTDYDIDHRPLICGDISQQPFVPKNLKVYADDRSREIINENAIYLPNHCGLSQEDIQYMAQALSEL